MGLGREHTSVCLSASKAKQNPTEYSDCRLSLIGDSFACSSFMFFAAVAGFPWTKEINLKQMNQRLGLPPGATSAIHVVCPLSTSCSYGNFPPSVATAKSLNVFLAQRANHTGSDVKVTTGESLIPNSFPGKVLGATGGTGSPYFPCVGSCRST